MFGWIFLWIYLALLYTEGAAIDPVPGYQLYENKNCHSNDLWQGWVTDEVACGEVCDAQPECVAFVIQNSGGFYCYRKSACIEGSLYWVSGLYTYIKQDRTTEEPTSTSDDDLTTEITTTEVVPTDPSKDQTSTPPEEKITNTPVSLPLYTVAVEEDIVVEAPSAEGIGAFMILLLIGFIIFFVAIDVDSYFRAFKRCFRNISYGMKHRRRKSDKMDTTIEERKDRVKDLDNEEVITKQTSMESESCPKAAEVTLVNEADSDSRSKTEDNAKHKQTKRKIPKQKALKTKKELVKQMSRKSLVYHIEDVE